MAEHKYEFGLFVIQSVLKYASPSSEPDTSEGSEWGKNPPKKIDPGNALCT